MTDFENHRDSDGNIDSYIAFRGSAPKRAVEQMEELYSIMLDIEKEHGMKASLVYLQGFLDERHTNYNDFVAELVKPQSLVEKLFSIMKKSFLSTHWIRKEEQPFNYFSANFTNQAGLGISLTFSRFS